MGNLLQQPQKDPAIYTIAPLLQKASTEQPNHALLLHAKDLLLKMESVIKQLGNYQEKASDIRESLAKPKDADLQKKAYESIVQNVKIIEAFYDLVETEVKDAVLNIINALSSPHAMEEQPILSYKLLHILQQVYILDELKMRTPALQNEFSFYRRSATKVDGDLPISETKAGQVSMWIANSIPATASVAEHLKKELGAGGREGGSEEVLVKAANMCCWISAKGGWCKIRDNVKFDGFNHDIKTNNAKQEQLMFQAMTTCIVLYDRFVKRGAFVKSSGFHMKKILEVLAAKSTVDAVELMGHGDEGGGKEETAASREEVINGCKSRIKYSSLNIGKASTPDFVDNLLSI